LAIEPEAAQVLEKLLHLRPDFPMAFLLGSAPISGAGKIANMIWIREVFRVLISSQSWQIRTTLNKFLGPSYISLRVFLASVLLPRFSHWPIRMARVSAAY
jgi:hypothetical protein